MLNGAVLEAAHLWGIDTLRGYDLRDAFLLGISLAGKRLEGCNATGAVFKNVHTDGWALDGATIAATTYIYTDYTRETVTDDDGNEREVFKPVEESRVPADGAFGDADNPRFTLETYFFQPHEWNLALNFPRRLQRGIVDYLNFFPEYARVTHGLDVATTPHREGQKIRLTFAIDDAKQQPNVKAALADYMQHLFTPIDDIREAVVFHDSRVTEQEKAEHVAELTSNLLHSRILMAHEFGQLTSLQQQAVNQQFAHTLERIDSKLATVQGGMLVLAELAKTPPAPITIIQKNENNARAVVHNTVSVRLELTTLAELVQAAPDDALSPALRQEYAEVLSEIKDALKAKNTATAQSMWGSVWKSLKNTTDLFAKVPKLQDAAEVIQGMMGTL
ncbi:MAG: hypothetical protein AAF730_06965 [Bacteroidota bacterium]